MKRHIWVMWMAAAAGPVCAQQGYGIAYAGSCEGSQGICVMRAGGSDARLLVRGFGFMGLQASPDGQKIVYLDPASRGVRLANLDGSGTEALPVKLTGMDIQMVWSPDSTRLAFASAFEDPHANDPEVQRGHALYSTAIYVMNVETKKATRRSALGQNRWISWAPEGRRIVFSGTQPGAQKGDIFVVDAEGGNPHSIYSGTTNNVQPAWSPAGDQIAFLAAPMGGGRPEDVGLFVMRPDGTGARLVSANVGPTVGWSPDGRFILTGSKVIEVATGAAVDLGKVVADGTFAPDGRSVIYWAFDQGKSTISAVDVDGTNRRKVADGSFFTVYR